MRLNGFAYCKVQLVSLREVLGNYTLKRIF